MLATLFLGLAMHAASSPFDDYIKRPDETFKITSRQVDHAAFVSQTWQGLSWTHTLRIFRPKTTKHPSTAVLEITGGHENEVDAARAQQAADLCGMPVAVLWDIPNQPIWDLHEDDLIAETFARAIKTKDWTLPLLLPMTKSAVRAMDVVKTLTQGQISKFVVTGASKRGWTTWLVGATADRRVIGIAPRVFENLDVRTQAKHQVEDWGQPSEMWEPYVKRHLLDNLDSPEVTILSAIVDPVNYLQRVRMPVLTMRASNDPYWLPDAERVYWNRIRGPKAEWISLNEGHFSGDAMLSNATLAEFAGRCAAGKSLPELSAALANKAITITAESTIVKAKIYNATVSGRDFRDAKWALWKEVGLKQGKGSVTVPDAVGSAGYIVSAQLPSGASIFAPALIVRKDTTPR